MNSTEGSGVRALKCPQCGANLPSATATTIICQYCGTKLILTGEKTGAGQPGSQLIRGIRLKMFVYTDTQGTGLELFRVLLPVGWQFQGGCNWLLDNPGMPATVAFRVHNPQGAEVFEVFPNMNFIWNKNPLARGMSPKGSRYFGAEVRPVMGIQEALRNLLLPRYRSGVENLRIVYEENLPDLPRLARSEAPLAGGSAEGGKMRIQFTWKGHQLEEEIYGVVEVFRAPTASMFGHSEVFIWFLDFLFSFRAAAGRLDNAGKLFYVMISSFQLNPQWYAAYKSIVHTMAQMQIQRIQHIGQIGQIYAQTGREIREQNLRDWYSRQEVYDRLATERSRQIRGVDGFFDPHKQEIVELPSGYGNAWANNLGEYILTEDPNFNPNQYSNQHWEPMPQK
jgi:DNA-directed RNA polymerase subunit RPC12/RpoP